MKNGISKCVDSTYVVNIDCCQCGMTAQLSFTDRSAAYRRLRRPYRCGECSKQHHSAISKGLWQDKQYRKTITEKNVETAKNMTYDTQRISETNKRLWQNPEYRENQIKIRSKVGKEKWQNPEYRAKMLLIIVKRWQDPKYAEKMARMTRCIWKSSDYANKVVSGIKAKWRDEVFRAKMSPIQRQTALKAWANPSFRKTISNAIKEKYKNKEFREWMRQITIKSHPLKPAEAVIAQLAIKHGDKFDYSETVYKGSRAKIAVRCLKCNKVNYSYIHNHIKNATCNYCQISKGQRSIIDFLVSLSIVSSINDRKAIYPSELDIYIPESKLAIEYHGLYIHSFDHIPTKKRQLSHQNKAITCRDSGIKLLQVFSDEWDNQRPLVESMIKYHLGLLTTVAARKCKLVTLTNRTEFFDQNHLQGHRNARIILGLEYDNDLVAAMSFCGHKKYQWEIIRLATKRNIVVVGGASKLFKAFVDSYHPDSILSHADLRYSYGAIYEGLGFKQVKITRPNYFYTDKYVVFSRQSHQKHKLLKLFGAVDDNKTEIQNCLENGLRIGYDAGCTQWVWSKYKSPGLDSDPSTQLPTKADGR